MHDTYEQLAFHLSTLGMGFPYREVLLEILRENLTPAEARVLLALPTRVAPLQPVSVDDVAPKSNLSTDALAKMLEDLAERGLLFSGRTKEGRKGYALQQVGFGFPQTFFWKGEDTPHARKMTDLVARYFGRQVTAEAYASTETKPYRYIPTADSIGQDIQAVLPYHTMERVVEQARTFAVAHCPCRVTWNMRGRGCDHPVEVCLKFDDMAEYLIDRGLGRPLTKDETLQVIRKTEEAGLVHFVDNAIGDIKHNCNCCGCACWNVGSIRRRKIPRDVLMATYFIRQTEEAACSGCGDCVQICPVDAVTIDDGCSSVDEEWCIGCGVCVSRCPTGAASLRLRTDRAGNQPLPDFAKLHDRILKERKLSQT